MAITYRMNGKPITRKRVLTLIALHVPLDDLNVALIGLERCREGELSNAEEQSTDGYMQRDYLEGQIEGLTIRHPNEEQS